MRQLLVVATLWLATSLGWAADDSAKILDCMRANIPNTVQVKTLELTATDRTGGQRTLKGRMYATNEKGRLRAMMRIEGPADLAGASYLLREGREGGGADEMYVYVPALSKVRRITGASVDGSLWGTDLSYSDIKQIQNAFSGSLAKAEGAGEVDQVPVNILSLQPTVEQGTRYTRIRSWVDQKTCVALKVDFEVGTTVRKRLTVDAKKLEQSASRWYASDLTMSDLKEGTKTRVKVLGVTNDKNLADRYFNPTTFYIGS